MAARQEFESAINETHQIHRMVQWGILSPEEGVGKIQDVRTKLGLPALQGEAKEELLKALKVFHVSALTLTPL